MVYGEKFFETKKKKEQETVKQTIKSIIAQIKNRKLHRNKTKAQQLYNTTTEQTHKLCIAKIAIDSSLDF